MTDERMAEQVYTAMHAVTMRRMCWSVVCNRDIRVIAERPDLGTVGDGPAPISPVKIGHEAEPHDEFVYGECLTCGGIDWYGEKDFYGDD